MLPRHLAPAQSRVLRSFSSKAEAFLNSLINYETAGVPAGAGTASADGFDLVRRRMHAPVPVHAWHGDRPDPGSHVCEHVVPRLHAQGRMHALLAALGQPQRKLRVAHITGTKGKGSTATMLSAILQAAQYRVGTYTRCHSVIQICHICPRSCRASCTLDTAILLGGICMSVGACLLASLLSSSLSAAAQSTRGVADGTRRRGRGADRFSRPRGAHRPPRRRDRRRPPAATRAKPLRGPHRPRTAPFRRPEGRRFPPRHKPCDKVSRHDLTAVTITESPSSHGMPAHVFKLAVAQRGPTAGAHNRWTSR